MADLTARWFQFIPVATDMADLTARCCNFNAGATDMADLTARWFNFNVVAADVADLTARAGGAIRLPNPGIAAIHLLFLAISNATIRLNGSFA